jgi:hypothetical protein
MKRRFTAFIAALALTLMLALPASAGARTKWLCTPPGEDETTFVSAADQAFDGINRANDRAGLLAFNRLFGEECRVVLEP